MKTLQNGLLISFLALAVLLLAGPPAFADDAAGAVKGVVALNGKPLADGKVTFHLDNGQFVGSKIKNGEYKVDLIPAGEYRITVEGKGVPAKYASEETTGLSYAVVAGKQNLDLVVTD